MLPFLYHELSKMLKSFMQIFVKPSKLESCLTIAEILAIDLEDDGNLIDCAKVFVGLAAKENLNTLKLSDPWLREFK